MVCHASEGIKLQNTRQEQTIWVKSWTDSFIGFIKKDRNFHMLPRFPSEHLSTTEFSTMGGGGGGRGFLGPLLVSNLVVYLSILGLAGWSLDKYIDGESNHPHLGGNPATNFVMIFAMVAGVLGASSVLFGFVHLRTWRSESSAAAASLAIISWASTALAFGFVVKEMILGGRRGKRLQTLEAFIFISVLSELLYVAILLSAMFQTEVEPYNRYSSQQYGSTRSAASGRQAPKNGTSAAVQE